MVGFERGGGDSRDWHQGQGRFADYRFYSDVSVDNFNAVLYGYAIYHDLAADAAQRRIIAHDVDRLMTHLLDNQYRIIDLNGEVTQYGHVGMDPDPARDAYYQKVYARDAGALQRRPSLAAFAARQPHGLPDLLIAYHITGKQRYIDEYRRSSPASATIRSRRAIRGRGRSKRSPASITRARARHTRRCSI